VGDGARRCTAAPRIPYTQQELSWRRFPAFRAPHLGRRPVDRVGTAVGRDPRSGAATDRAGAVRRGADGAFGAASWRVVGRGTRPQFTNRDGASRVSAFAFLGPTYDETSGIVSRRVKWRTSCSPTSWQDYSGTSLFKTAPLQELIGAACGRQMLARSRSNIGRTRLYIVTTTSMTQRTRSGTWQDCGQRRRPRALDLFRNVLTASASIPACFRRSHRRGARDSGLRKCTSMRRDDEHIDPFPRPCCVPARPLFSSDARPKVYIVMNGKLAARFRSRDGLDADDRDAFRSKRRCAPTPAIRCWRPINS